MESSRVRTAIVLLAIFAVVSLPGTASSAADDQPGRKALVRQGARLWGSYCGSCHNARPAGERSPAEWDVIMMHMRVRANLPADDARAIREFLEVR